MQGMDEALGWSGFQDKTHSFVYSLPETRLLPLAEHIKRVLGCEAVRLVGCDNLRVRRVGSLSFPAPVPLKVRWRPCLPVWMRWWSGKPVNGLSANTSGMRFSSDSIWALWSLGTATARKRGCGMWLAGFGRFFLTLTLRSCLWEIRCVRSDPRQAVLIGVFLFHPSHPEAGAGFPRLGSKKQLQIEAMNMRSMIHPPLPVYQNMCQGRFKNSVHKHDNYLVKCRHGCHTI